MPHKMCEIYCATGNLQRLYIGCASFGLKFMFGERYANEFAKPQRNLHKNLLSQPSTHFQPLLPLIEQTSLLNTLPLSPFPRVERGLGGVGGAKRKPSNEIHSHNRELLRNGIERQSCRSGDSHSRSCLQTRYQNTPLLRPTRRY